MKLIKFSNKTKFFLLNLQIVIDILTDLVKVERVFSGDGAVEPGLEEGRPAVAKLMRTSLVLLADSSDPRVHDLQSQTDKSQGAQVWMLKLIPNY